MSNQTIIRDALLLLHEVVFIVTNTTGLVGRNGYKFEVGMYREKGKGKASKGMSDLTGMLKNGKHFAIETKTKYEALSPEQITYLYLVQDNGGVAGVARTPEDAINIIRGKLK